MNKFYWYVPLIILIFQLIYTLTAQNQIRYEELAESIRNVYWLSQHKIYDGVSNGVGWYGVLMFVYDIFGFNIFTAKYVRLFLQLLSLFSLAYLLAKYLGKKNALIPLITIGISPTILFFNTIQSEYGLDLQLFPIYLLLLDLVNFKNKWRDISLLIVLWSLTMSGAMGYPTIAFYIPVLGCLFLLKSYYFIKGNTKYLSKIITYVLVSIIAFITPLIAIFSYLEPHSQQLLVYDNVTKSGLFRGSGSFNFDITNFERTMQGLFVDLFSTGNSYYFEVYASDFSYYLPMISFLVILLYPFYPSLSEKKYRNLMYLALFFILLNILVFGFTFDPSGRPGLRRFTPLIAGIYVLYTFAWFSINTIPWKNVNYKNIVFLILLFIPIHHILVYPINLASFQNISPYSERMWFALAQSPNESFQEVLKVTQIQELKLGCKNDQGQISSTCRYGEIYGAVAGACLWNKLACNDIIGYDISTKNFVSLSPDLWESYHFEH